MDQEDRPLYNNRSSYKNRSPSMPSPFGEITTTVIAIMIVVVMIIAFFIGVFSLVTTIVESSDPIPKIN